MKTKSLIIGAGLALAAPFLTGTASAEPGASCCASAEKAACETKAACSTEACDKSGNFISNLFRGQGRSGYAYHARRNAEGATVRSSAAVTTIGLSVEEEGVRLRSGGRSGYVYRH